MLHDFADETPGIGQEIGRGIGQEAERGIGQEVGRGIAAGPEVVTAPGDLEVGRRREGERGGG